MRMLFGALLALLIVLPTFAQDESPNKVPGLEVTAGGTVQPTEGFVIVEAKCAGPVSWIVLGTTPNLKYKVYTAEKEIVVAVPGPGHGFTVLCVGFVDGMPT